MSYIILLGMSIVCLLMLMLLMKQELRDIKQEMKQMKKMDHLARDCILGLMCTISGKDIATPKQLCDAIDASINLRDTDQYKWF